MGAFELIIYSLGTMLLEAFCLYSWHKLLGRKIDFKNFKNYIALLLMTILVVIINLFVPQYLKIFFVVISLLLINYFFVCKSFEECVVTVFVSQFIIMVSEFVLVLLITLCLGENMNKFMDAFYSILVLNSLIILFSILLFRSKLPFKIYSYFINTFDNARNSNLIIYLVIIIVLAGLFMIMTYMSLPLSVLLICNTLLTILYVAIILKMINAKASYDKINSKFETSLSSLKEYEEIMDQYKIANHENKNQLLTIRNMIKRDDKRSIDYIDKIVDNKIKDNEAIFYKTSKIPEGGLRATIYSKMCKMKELGIDYKLNISNDVRTVDLIKIDDNTVLNICKIIGVFLDNAIEEVSRLDKKLVEIDMFVMNDSLCIDISNNFTGDLDINKIDKVKYSTKGTGHGYGLSLVNKILKEDECLENERKINKNVFTQELKIKMPEKKQLINN